MLNTLSYDEGTLGAKVESRDELLEIMRRIVRENPSATQGVCAKLFYEEIKDDPELVQRACEYAGANIWRRCHAPIRRSFTLYEDFEVKARELIQSQIKLWRWRVPGTGKALPDCTFAELAAVGPQVNRFVYRLASQGVPTDKVRDVFKNEAALQAFWISVQ